MSGTDSITIGHINLELGTLGGANSSINWNGINDPGEAVGMSETAASDPNGEDICVLRHSPRLPSVPLENGVMTALPTVGGLTGRPAPSITEDKSQDMRKTVWWTPPARRAILIIALTSRSCGQKATPKPLPTIGTDPDGVAYGINNQGQAVGYSGTCTAVNSAVVWENNMLRSFPASDKSRAIAYEINDRGQIVGQGVTSDGVPLATLWENNTVTALGARPSAGRCCLLCHQHQ